MKRLMISRSFLVKLLVSNTLIIVSAMILVSLVNYHYNTENSKKQIAESYGKLLLQANYSIESLYIRTIEMGEQLYEDKDVIKGLYADDLEPIDQYHIGVRLSDIPDTMYIQSLYLYNGHNNRFIHTINQDINIEQIDQDVFKIIQEQQENMKITFLPHVQQYTYYDTEYKNNLLSLVFLFSGHHSEDALLINIKEDALLDLFQSMENQQPSTFVVMDKKGRVISHSQKPELFMSLIDEKPYVEEIINRHQYTGYFIDNVEDKESLVTYVYNEKLGLYLMSITDYTSITAGIKDLQFPIIFISLIILILGVFVSATLVGYFYLPLGKIVRMLKLNVDFSVEDKENNEIAYMDKVLKGMIHKITTLEDTAVKGMISIRENYLKSLLTRELTPSIDEIDVKFKELNIAIDAKNINIIVFKINKYDIAKLGSDTSLDLIKNTINEIVCSTLSDRYNPVMINMGLNTIVFALNSENIRLINEITYVLERIEQLMSIRLKVGIGVRVKSIHDIANCYEQAKEALEYDFVFYEDYIFDYSDIYKQINKNYKYSSKYEKKIMEYIKLNDKDKSIKMIKQLIEELQRCSHNDIDHALRQLGMTMDREFGELVDMELILSDYKYKKISKVIINLDSIYGVQNFLIKLCTDIILWMKNNRSKSSNELVTKACRYIDENYSDSNISAEAVASMLNITVPYFSKLFSGTVNTSYTKYLTEVRMKKAKELLNDTGLNINEISKKVGLLNPSYFITIFKKKYGVSPNQYRQLNQTDYN